MIRTQLTWLPVIQSVNTRFSLKSKVTSVTSKRLNVYQRTLASTSVKNTNKVTFGLLKTCARLAIVQLNQIKTVSILLNANLNVAVIAPQAISELLKLILVAVPASQWLVKLTAKARVSVMNGFL